MNDTDWPETGLEYLGKCPVCGSEQRSLLHEKLVDRVFFCAPGTWRLFLCGACASAYLDPRPDRQTIGLAYEQYYTHGAHQTAHPGAGRSGQKFFPRVLDNSYLNYRYGTHRKPALPVGRTVSKLMANRVARLDSLMRHLPPSGNCRRLLDFGCGSGRFLTLAQQAGWDVLGIDFDPRAVATARARGLTVLQGGLEQLQDLSGEFDVVTLSHVIEHMHDFRSLLVNCYRVLQPGGFLWLETPNVDARGHQLFGPDWRGLEPPRHLLLFSVKSLTDTLCSTGFKQVEILPQTPAMLEVFCRSEAIRARRDPYGQDELDNYRATGHWRDYEAEAERDPKVREFITLKAVK